MNLLTLISDYGENNYLIAVLKAHLYRLNNIQILDIFHGNSMTDIESTAYQLFNAISQFPEETIHLVFNKFQLKDPHALLVAKINNQYIICPDNGIFYLIHQIEPTAIVRKIILEPSIDLYNIVDATEVYTKLSQQILIEKGIQSIGEEILNVNPSIPFSSGLVCDAERILFRIIHIDDNSHAITNVTKQVFDKYCQGKSFEILFANTTIRTISSQYKMVDFSNQIGAMFNNSGFLEIYMLGDKLCKLYNISKKNSNSYQIKIL